MAIRTFGIPGIALAARGQGEGASTPLSANDQDTIRHLRVQLDVPAITGTTPRLIVVVEDTLDGGTSWNTLLSMSVVNSPGREVRDLEVHQCGQVRSRWFVIGSDTQATFSVSTWATVEVYP